MSAWIRCEDKLPLPNQAVETKIDDALGLRNVGKLKRVNNLWFLADGSMYVYYTPTHWKPLCRADQLEEAAKELRRECLHG